jgi:hypothetical protein
MVIHDFDAFGPATRPPKADSPLVVDADAVLPLPVTLQGLQSVTRRNPQIAEATRDLELAKLATRHVGTGFEAPDPVTARQGSSIRASE